MKINLDKLKSLSPSEQQKFIGLFKPKMNIYNSYHTPFPKQALAMVMPVRELLYGGSVGGGKLILASLV